MGEKSKKNKITWSDDLSYDSEEEREKERLALAELAEIEAPVKPSYSDEELASLVNYVKNMTSVCHLHAQDWSDQCVETIKFFFNEPKHYLLTIYFQDDQLKALLDIPKDFARNLNYFLRDADMIFTVENFHDEITFGTVFESAEGSLLKMLEYVYTPMFLASVNWPKNVKNEFCMKLYVFLLKLTDVYNKMMGLTVIYVPRDGIGKTVEEASNDKELVKRLENIVVYWIQQIKMCMEDRSLIATNKELMCPADELMFWIYRFENLNSINYQINNSIVTDICEILKNVHSSYINQFEISARQIADSIVEAKSNIDFLELVSETCGEMERETDLEELSKYILKIFNTFKFIGTHSPFLNSPEKLTNLCQYLSNQVIIQCSVSIDLKSLFAGNTRLAITQLGKCVDCCKSYKETYDSVATAHDCWNLDVGIIFNYIDAFIQRCVDMLEVCNGMIIFGRIDEVETNPVMRFLGRNGDESERICRDVELMFKDSLHKIECFEDRILDIQETSWNDAILNFRTEIKYIEEVVENLMVTSMRSINNIDEAIHLLCATHVYSKRENLQRCFEDITAQTWNIFEKEIDTIKKDIISEREYAPSNLPLYSGQAVMLNIRKKRISYVSTMMTYAIWLLPCSNSNDIQNQCKRLQSTIDSTLENIYQSWTNCLDEKLDSSLDRKLLAQSSVFSDLLDCNFDSNIQHLCAETTHWENMDFKRQQIYPRIFINLPKLRHLYESVVKITIQYNKIELLLSREEKQLFKQMKKVCRDIVIRGLFHLKWISEDTDVFISESLSEIEQLRNFIFAYKSCNNNIIKAYDDMCDYPFIELPNNKTYEIEDLKVELKKMWENALRQLLYFYKHVIRYFTIVFEGFEDHVESVIKSWISYLRYYDMLFEAVLRLNVRCTLENFFNRIKSSNLITPHPLINIKTVLADDEIRLKPSLMEIQNLFSEILPGIVEVVENVPRLYEKFGLPDIGLRPYHRSIEKDFMCKCLKNEILKESENALKMVRDHRNSWNDLNHLWKISKKDFVDEYLSKEPTAREFDKDILHYHTVANDIQIRDSVVQIRFLLVDNAALKRALVAECVQWQRALNEALASVARKGLDDVYTSAKHAERPFVGGSDLGSGGGVLGELQEAFDAYERLCAEILDDERTVDEVGGRIGELARRLYDGE